MDGCVEGTCFLTKDNGFMNNPKKYNGFTLIFLINL